MKYLRSMLMGCKDIGVRKSEFVAKTQFLCLNSMVFKELQVFLILFIHESERSFPQHCILSSTILHSRSLSLSLRLSRYCKVVFEVAPFLGNPLLRSFQYILKTKKNIRFKNIWNNIVITNKVRLIKHHYKKIATIPL